MAGPVAQVLHVVFREGVAVAIVPAVTSVVGKVEAIEHHVVFIHCFILLPRSKGIICSNLTRFAALIIRILAVPIANVLEGFMLKAGPIAVCSGVAGGAKAATITNVYCTDAPW